VNGSGDTPTQLVPLLLANHEEAKSRLQRVEQAAASKRDEAFCELTYALVRHEVAEEEVVYPAVRRYVDGGDDLADMRIAEQSKAEDLLAEMEKVGVGSPQFPAMFTTLRSEVLAHAQAEGQSVFSELSASPDELLELGKRYELAKMVAPTRPPASARSGHAPGQLGHGAGGCSGRPGARRRARGEELHLSGAGADRPSPAAGRSRPRVSRRGWGTSP